MSTFHAKLRTFAECKREAVKDAYIRAVFRNRLAARNAVAREARLLRKQRARHKRMVTRFGAKWAHWMRYDCVHITPEALRCDDSGATDGQVERFREKYPDVWRAIARAKNT